MRTQIEDFYNQIETRELNSASNKFDSIIKNCASSMTKSQQVSKTSGYVANSWFDAECHRSKMEMVRTLSKFRKNTADKNLQQYLKKDDLFSKEKNINTSLSFL